MATKERPILFSAPMVRALLDGRKTQTRRVMKPQPELSGKLLWWNWKPGFGAANLAGAYHSDGSVRRCDEWFRHCPYGRPGDMLWVKETYADLTATHGQPWERRNPNTGLYERGRKPFLWYRADGEQPDIGDGRSPVDRWRPSIHMPRWASRIDLEVTGVRVERLQDISEADAMAEGASFHDGRGIGHSGWRHDFGAVHSDARSAFARLWESINGLGSWDANPWVWVVEFKRIKP